MSKYTNAYLQLARLRHARSRHVTSQACMRGSGGNTDELGKRSIYSVTIIHTLYRLCIRIRKRPVQWRHRSTAGQDADWAIV